MSDLGYNWVAQIPDFKSALRVVKMWFQFDFMQRKFGLSGNHFSASYESSEFCQHSANALNTRSDTSSYSNFAKKATLVLFLWYCFFAYSSFWSNICHTSNENLSDLRAWAKVSEHDLRSKVHGIPGLQISKCWRMRALWISLLDSSIFWSQGFD